MYMHDARWVVVTLITNYKRGVIAQHRFVAGLRGGSIEEGWRQKPRQTVVVLEWGARSNAALRILV